MGRTYVSSAILLTMGLLSVSHGDDFCTPGHDPVGDDVVISQEECVDHYVTGIWTASTGVETEIKIKCFNGTQETGLIDGYDRARSEGGNITAQVPPELEGNVQCVIQGCYEDGDFDIYSIESVSVDCVSSEDVAPSPTPSPSPTTLLPLNSTPVSGSSSDSLADNNEDNPTISPTTQTPHSTLLHSADETMFSPSTSPTTQTASPLNLTLLYILAPIAVLLALSLFVGITIVAFKQGQRQRIDWKNLQWTVSEQVDSKFNPVNLDNPLCYQSSTTIPDLLEVASVELDTVVVENPNFTKQNKTQGQDSKPLSALSVQNGKTTPDEENGMLPPKVHTVVPPEVDTVSKPAQLDSTTSNNTSHAYKSDTSGGSGSGSSVPGSANFGGYIPTDADISSRDMRSPSPFTSFDVDYERTDDAVVLDVDKGERPVYQSQLDSPFLSKKEHESTTLCSNDPAGPECFSEFLKGALQPCDSTLPTSGSGFSTATSGNYVSHPSSDHRSTED